MKSNRNAGFTLTETMIAAVIAIGVALGMVSFTWASARLGAKNLAYNHGNAAFTQACNRLVKDCQASASTFTLVDFNGTTYTDSTVSISADQDPLTLQYLSSRSNAVRFWMRMGGPYQLTASTTPTSTSFTFNFGPAVNGALQYTPTVNDKLWFPLINKELQITAVTTAPTAASPTGVVTAVNASGMQTGYTLSTSSPNVTTAIFYRQVAFSVYNNQLRFHPNFSAATQATCVSACQNITSPKPFSLLYATSTSTVPTTTTLRLSFEAYDLNYSNLAFPNGAATLQTIIAGRDQPPFVTALQTPL
jgi:type II secretory pathway pseudopilin PulG